MSSLKSYLPHLQRRLTWMPELGAEINWEHPLTRGLCRCYFYNRFQNYDYDSSPAVRVRVPNLVRNQPDDMITRLWGDSTWAFAKVSHVPNVGIGVGQNDLSYGDISLGINGWTTPDGITLEAWVWLKAGTSTSELQWGDALLQKESLYITYSGPENGKWGGGTTNYDAVPSGHPYVDDWVFSQGIVTFSAATGIRVFDNGLFNASTTPPGDSTNGSKIQGVLNDAGISKKNPDLILAALRGWNRILSDQEIHQLRADPWAMFRPTRGAGAFQTINPPSLGFGPIPQYA